MHELLITQSILDIAIATANEHNASRINAIYLVIGELAGIVDDSVQFYFDFLSKDTLAEEAQLHFRREPATATCQICTAQTNVTPPLIASCPACGSPRIVISGGRQCHVESIDID
ncbi:MAG: hydrogenase maturation nickel metallochaperone HypA [Caldilineales bacterium]|nr:hydrogenase maturation nickel metallochaperone HypA [Caldilineales bacterium]